MAAAMAAAMDVNWVVEMAARWVHSTVVLSVEKLGTLTVGLWAG